MIPIEKKEMLRTIKKEFSRVFLAFNPIIKIINAIIILNSSAIV
jgi:hypothetical protein